MRNVVDPSGAVRWPWRLGACLACCAVGIAVGVLEVRRVGNWAVGSVAGDAARHLLVGAAPAILALSGFRFRGPTMVGAACGLGAMYAATLMAYARDDRSTAALIFFWWWLGAGALGLGVLAARWRDFWDPERWTM